MFDVKTLAFKRDFETPVVLAEVSWTFNVEGSLGGWDSFSSTPFLPCKDASQLLMLGLNGFAMFDSTNAQLLYTKLFYEGTSGNGSTTLVGDCVFNLRTDWEERDAVGRFKMGVDASSAVVFEGSSLSMDRVYNCWQPTQGYSTRAATLGTFVPPPDMVFHDNEFIVTSKEIVEIESRALIARVPAKCVFVSGLNDGFVYFWRQEEGKLGRLKVAQAAITKNKKKKNEKQVLGPHEKMTSSVRLGARVDLSAVTRYLLHVFTAGFSVSHSPLLCLPLIRQTEMAALCQLAILQVALREFGHLPLCETALNALTPHCQDGVAFHNAIQFILSETLLFAR